MPDLRRASGRPFRWDFMTWILSEIDLRRCARDQNSCRDIVWESRDAHQDARNARRAAAWHKTRAMLPRHAAQI